MDQGSTRPPRLRVTTRRTESSFSTSSTRKRLVIGPARTARTLLQCSRRKYPADRGPRGTPARAEEEGKPRRSLAAKRPSYSKPVLHVARAALLHSGGRTGQFGHGVRVGHSAGAGNWTMVPLREASGRPRPRLYEATTDARQSQPVACAPSRDDDQTGRPRDAPVTETVMNRLDAAREELARRAPPPSPGAEGLARRRRLPPEHPDRPRIQSSRRTTSPPCGRRALSWSPSWWRPPPGIGGRTSSGATRRTRSMWPAPASSSPMRFTRWPTSRRFSSRPTAGGYGRRTTPTGARRSASRFRSRRRSEWRNRLAAALRRVMKIKQVALL